MAGERLVKKWPAGIVDRVEGRKGVVALTFDDGPNVPATSEVREILNGYGVRGTFFTVGKAVDAEPDVCRELLSDGHVIANHSYSHSLSAWLSPEDDDILGCQRAISRQLGVRPAFFRPPYGLLSRDMLRRISGNGLTCVTWDVAVEDWSLTDASEIARRVVENAGPGSIVLLHDGHDGDVSGDRSVLVEALPAIIEGLRARSLEPRGLDTLLETKPYLE
jgi:peptidoglycan/xylan/chitin deacetylase (PgdA/CDA1 family)